MLARASSLRVFRSVSRGATVAVANSISTARATTFARPSSYSPSTHTQSTLSSSSSSSSSLKYTIAPRIITRSYHFWPRFPERWLPPAPPLDDAALAAAHAGADPPLVGAIYPHHAIASVIDVLHASTGLSWVATGVLWVLLSRSALAPLLVANLKATYTAALTDAESLRLRQKSLDAAKRQDADEVRFWRREAGKWARMQPSAYGIASVGARFVYPLAMIPVTIASLWAFRLLSATFPSMRDGGHLWFTDLAARTIDVDPTLTLPLLCASLQIANMFYSLNSARKSPQGISLGAKALYTVGAGFLAFFTTISPFLPQGVIACYWLPSAVYGLLQTFAMTAFRERIQRFVRNSPQGKAALKLAQDRKANPVTYTRNVAHVQSSTSEIPSSNDATTTTATSTATLATADKPSLGNRKRVASGAVPRRSRNRQNTNKRRRRKP